MEKNIIERRDAMINQILDDFDFEGVFSCMNLIGNNSFNKKFSSIDEIKAHAKNLMEECFDEHLKDPEFTMVGQDTLYVECYPDGMMELSYRPICAEEFLEDF